MPIRNKPDPDYEPEPFEAFEDGKYPVSGIKWITADEEGAPIFVTSKGRSPLVARFRSILENEQDGPPGSVTPAEVTMLVKAMGGETEDLPNREEDPSAFLMSARDRINNATKVVTMRVSDGWVQDIPGMHLPADKYFTFEFAGIATKSDEVPKWREGAFGKWFGANLRVVGDLQQRRTPYDGYDQFCIISYGVIVSEDGTPEYEHRVKAGTNQRIPTSSGVETSRFIAAFAPEVEQGEFADVNNVLPEIHASGLKAQRRAVGQVFRSKNGRVGVKATSLAPIDAAPLPFPAEKGVEKPSEKLPERDVEEETEELPTMEAIYALITKGAEAKAFGTDGKLNPVGKAWCKEHLKPFLKANKFPARFTTWDENVMEKVLAFLTTAVGEEEDEF